MLNTPAEVADPTATPPASRLTVELASPIVLKVGWFLFVMLSELLVPVSSAVIRSGVMGAAGATLSMVTFNALDAKEKLVVATALEDATSIVMLCDAFESTPVVML